MVLVLKKGSTNQQIKALSKKLKPKKGVDVLKYCGKIKLKNDALILQNKLRDEWQ